MDAESTLAEKIVPPNNGSGETTDPAVLKEKAAEELKSAASLKGGGEETTNTPEAVPIEKDDLLERLEKIDTSSSPTTTTNDAVAAPTKETEAASSAATNDVDMENDDLIQRLEAIEKGEVEETTASVADSSKKEEDKKEENHQNGLEKADEAELLEEKMEVDSAEATADKKEDSTATAEKTTNGSSSADHDTQAASSAKRRHSEDEEQEPSSKKVHVEEDSKKPETVTEEKKEEPVVEEAKPESVPEEKSESEPTVEEKPKQEDQPAVEESVKAESEQEPPKEPETVEEPPKEGGKVSKEDAVDSAKESTAESKDEQTASEEKPLEESAPPPEPDPVEETDSKVEPPALETEEKNDEKPVEEPPVPEKKDEKPAEEPSVPEKKDEPELEPTVEAKKPAEEEAKAEVVADSGAEKESVAVESTEKLEEKSEEDREPAEEAKQEPVASTEKVEPVVEAEKETKPEEVPTASEEKPEALPDTEPNTESESQQEEQPTSSSVAEVEEKSDDAAISSSSEPKEPETAEANAGEVETVTSSDEKPAAEPETVVDFTPEAAPTSAPVEPQVDEAMEVDAAEPVVEKSEVAEVSETPCAKKEAYQCTEKVEDKKEDTPEAAPVAEPEKAPAEDEQMEVDSAAVPPSQSKSDGDVTEGMNTSSEELIKTLAKEDEEKEENVADSASETNTTATVSALDKNVDAEEVPPAAEESKVLDDSIECSLPTSSSDKMADRLKQRLDLISNGSSTPNAAVSSSNVYNSTPIQKQFEISSENVSKITRPSVDNSHQEEDEEHSAIVADNSTTVEEKEAVASTSAGAAAQEPQPKKEAPETSKQLAASSVKEESSVKSSESSEVDSCTASSALNTAEETNLYASNARKFNGISSTSGSELDDKAAVQTPTNVTTTAASTTTTTTAAANKLDLTQALTSEEALYEVSVWFDGVEMQFLSVEKVIENKLVAPGLAGSTQDLTGIDSSKQSSNGSVGSLGPFQLPSARPAADSHSSATDSSGTISSQSKAPLSKVKHTVRGAKALASLMIEEFTKIKRALSKDDELSDAELDQSSSNLKTPKTATKKGGRGQKRSRTESEAEEESKSKQTSSSSSSKSVKKQKPDTPVPAESESPANQDDWLCCLARWSDRKYYAGKVTGYKGDNKYMVLFEDGASKALSKDVIVIGDKDTLPIKGHAVHALTGGDTYETGMVEEVKRNEAANEVLYVVRIGDGTVEVTASDMYLNEEQAKLINKACKAAESADDPMQSPSASGKRGSATNTPILQTPDDSAVAGGEKGSRSTRSKRGGDKPQTPVTPEAGYSGGVGKKGRRGRSKAQSSAQPAGTVSISESSDVSDTLEEDMPAPPSPEADLESVDGVQPELQRTQKESEIRKMYLVAEYLGNGNGHTLEDILGPLPGSKTVFRNKHFILTCTIPPKGICSTPDKDDMRNKYRKFSLVPFVKEHLRLQIEMGGGKVYEHFEDIPKAKYKQCKLIAPHPSATAKYVQCLAVDIPAVSHEWIIECCRTLTFLDYKPYALPAGWSFLEERYIRWNCGRGVELRSTVNPFVGYCINIASLNTDFTEFWSRVCKMAGGTVRLIKSENDLTSNLSGFMLTDQEFPEDIKLRATRYGLQIVSTVWVVQSLIVGRVCQPDSHEKLTQIYQDDDY
uniref:Putative ribonuclease e n=1 Tax=Culex tarsalis TaxID=7177 RepID=A0A1Q3EWT4_CULTA